MTIELIFIEPDPLLDRPNVEAAKPFNVVLQIIKAAGGAESHFTLAAPGNGKVRAIIPRQFFSQVRRVCELRPGDRISAILDGEQVRTEVLECREA